MYWIDTHCHFYDTVFEKDREDIIEACQKQNIKKIFLPNIDDTTIHKSLALQKKYPNFLYSMNGLHPCYINEKWKEKWELIEPLFTKNSFVAIGEIGLDYYHNAKNKIFQQQALHSQITKAIELKLPIVLHTRNAVKDCVTILQQYKSSKLKGIFHCFSEGYEYIQDIIDLGFSFGIGGIVTFKKNNLINMLNNIPLEKIVLETDAPYLAPQPYRGKRNSPHYIPLIGESIAIVKNIPMDKIASITSSNAENIFH